MLACGADIVARSTAGERVIPIGDFLLGLFTTALRPDELLTEVRVPRYHGPAGGTYLKLERKVGDYATVGVAVHLQLDEGKERIAEAGIALTSVAPSNLKAVAAEQALVSEAPGDQLFAEAGDLAARAAEPRSDVRGPAEYKRDVVRVFVQRGLARAMELARAA
jgi:carbon-monoxide dehydrogenase medium subunit